MKDIGDIFKNDIGKWEIIRYDVLEDKYICHKLDSFRYETRKFSIEEIEEAKK